VNLKVSQNQRWHRGKKN